MCDTKKKRVLRQNLKPRDVVNISNFMKQPQVSIVNTAPHSSIYGLSLTSFISFPQAMLGKHLEWLLHLLKQGQGRSNKSWVKVVLWDYDPVLTILYHVNKQWRSSFPPNHGTHTIRFAWTHQIFNGQRCTVFARYQKTGKWSILTLAKPQGTPPTINSCHSKLALSCERRL